MHPERRENAEQIAEKTAHALIILISLLIAWMICSAPTPELYYEALCNRSCYTIEGYWVYQSQANTLWQVCSEWIIGTQHLDYAISLDIAIMYNKETKTTEQLAHHGLYDTKIS